jgi:BirA family biotin operon repressor/biotin-[acetyl-CoA-carboxylase] ligase
MNTLFIGQKIISLEQTDSTNSFMLRLLKSENIYEGTVVVTRKQEQGRGQRGTSWESEPGKNLTLSIFLCPLFLKPDEQFFLNKVISLGVAEFVISLLKREKGKKVKIKWPNDIYIGNKKVAGILIENSVSGKWLQHSIAGIGININQEKFSSCIPNPTSLKIVTGKEFDLKECLSGLCSCIEKRYLQLKANHREKIDSDYLSAIYRFGEVANYRYKDELLSAKITGVTMSGKLILKTEEEKIFECDYKEVEFC